MIRSLKFNILGKKFVYNAAFAASAALLLGAGEDAVRRGLEEYLPSEMRQSISEKNGITVISDCYNSAPESVRAAIDTLSSLEVTGKRIAVLGDMRELGADSDKMHREVGEYAARNGVDVLLTLGESGAYIAEGAIRCGMNAHCVFVERDTDNIEKLCLEIENKMSKGDAVLFKASRSLRLERAIERLFGAK